MMGSKSFSYADRIELSSSALARRLFKLMSDKQSNLAVSADVTSANELLQLAETLGPEICVLKTHIDIIQDFTPELTEKLRALADKYHFLIFEDRKFADIGNTVKQQFNGGIYQIAHWADIVNAHSLPGPGIIQGLTATSNERDCGLLLIAEMSSSGHLLNKNYQRETLKMAESHAESVFGFITQHALTSDPQWVNFTPGINLSGGSDQLGQQYTTPEQAILQQASDVVIVGRGIVSASQPVEMAKQYRKAAWQAYLKRYQN